MKKYGCQNIDITKNIITEGLTAITKHLFKFLEARKN